MVLTVARAEGRNAPRNGALENGALALNHWAYAHGMAGRGVAYPAPLALASLSRMSLASALHAS
ncbi:hypothetical protein CCS01_16880 [Rhodopila globiformis]|uniref:Uncharacterized protein n=1 Tax=Rhodopila globiformis TaxID=1071 RepID=A0A2S6NAT2_RHOGL|nr:hypothetical protein CCS01_16880 [Rhodopila globiformis]